MTEPVDMSQRWEAQRDQATTLRAEIMERVRILHQLVVVSGAIAAAAGTVLLRGGAPAPPELLLGLSLLFLAIGFAMLNQEICIVQASRFLASNEALGPAGMQWNKWETFLSLEHHPKLLVNFLPAVAQYAVPVFGSVAAGTAFVIAAEGNDRWFVAIPAICGAFFLFSGVRTWGGYKSISTSPASKLVREAGSTPPAPSAGDSDGADGPPPDSSSD